MSLPIFNTLGYYKDDTTVYLPPYSPTEPTALVYFITGNPGLIRYYTTFLQTLSDLLRNPNDQPVRVDRTHINLSVLGTSLAGFETKSREKPHEGPFSLQAQIELSELRLKTFLHRHAEALPDSCEPTKVILMGHSVGAYILLELLRRHQNGDGGFPKGAEIVGSISLFPTVTWIAKSPSGRRLGWALKLRGFARVVGGLARVLGFVVPDFILRRIVGIVANVPPDVARTTTALLRSPLGVRQMLWMAAEEMTTIEEDKWDEALWACEKTKLVFYFGEKDHWVDCALRDELIKLRGSGEGRREWPKMVVDELRIPHDFCIARSDATAMITAKWVEKILAD